MDKTEILFAFMIGVILFALLFVVFIMGFVFFKSNKFCSNQSDIPYPYCMSGKYMSVELK